MANKLSETMATLFGLVEPTVKISRRHYDTFANYLHGLSSKAGGLVLAVNYAGADKYARPYIEPRLHASKTPYERCEIRMVRPPNPQIISPSWREYETIMKRLGGNPHHAFFDDNISPEAFGALFFYHWLKSHGIQDDRISLTGIFSGSGVADYCIVGDYREREDREQALQKLISEGVIPEILPPDFYPLSRRQQSSRVPKRTRIPRELLEKVG